MFFVKRQKVVFGFILGCILPWLKTLLIDGKGEISYFMFSCNKANFPKERDFYQTVENSKTFKNLFIKASTEDEILNISSSEKQSTKPNDLKSNSEKKHSYIFSKWEEGKRTRLLCWFMTDPNILMKTRNVKDTWTKQCDIRLFISSETDEDFPTIGVDVPSGRNHIGAKSRAAWTHIYRHYRDQADYFMKADPDSYIVVDNLKMFLSNRNPNEPEAYGHALFYGRQSWLGNFSGFYSAGQSVVLSRQALVKLASDGIDPKCFFDGQAEDLKTIVCLEKKGGAFVDTRDIMGRETFLPATGLNSVLQNLLPNWYTQYYRRYLGYCTELECLSHFPIVFHYVTSEMYLIEYLTRGSNQKQSRKVFIEDADAEGFLRFNGSILANLYNTSVEP